MSHYSSHSPAKGRSRTAGPYSILTKRTALTLFFEIYLVFNALAAISHEYMLYIDTIKACKSGTCGSAPWSYYTDTELCTYKDGSDYTAIWHSNNRNGDYNLTSTSGSVDTSGDDKLVVDIFDKDYTSRRQLFDGAVICNDMWNTGKNGW